MEGISHHERISPFDETSSKIKVHSLIPHTLLHETGAILHMRLMNCIGTNVLYIVDILYSPCNSFYAYLITIMYRLFKEKNSFASSMSGVSFGVTDVFKFMSELTGIETSQVQIEPCPAIGSRNGTSSLYACGLASATQTFTMLHLEIR